MPVMPKVPHIVGDDDDLSESDFPVEEQVSAQRKAGDPGSLVGRKTRDSHSSELSDLSYDNDSDMDEENSHSTAEEEDWSNNISYIVRTPERESAMEVKEENSSVPAVIKVEKTEDVDMESEEKENSEALEGSRSVSSTPKRINKATQGGSRLVKPHGTRSEQFKNSFSTAVSPIELFSPLSRRLSLRSASRLIPARATAPPTKNSRIRSRKSKLVDDFSPAKPLEAGVVKRPKAPVYLKSPVKKPSALLARPIEVTEYFLSISAQLVRQRVNLLPFLNMRKRIDRLVSEAITKTLSQRENN